MGLSEYASTAVAQTAVELEGVYMTVRNGKTCKGVWCEMIALDCYAFRLLGGCYWTYELWGRRLKCQGELVAEGVSSLADAVVFATGYETAVKDLVATEARKGAKKVSKEDSAKILPFGKMSPDGGPAA